MVSLRHIVNVDGALTGVFLEGPESAEFGPMAKVNFGIGTPIIVLCKKAVF